MDKVGLGVLGAGRMASFHNLGYRDDPRVEIRAVCDVDEGLVERRCAEWGVARGYTDYHEMLANADIDAVDVNTPHHLHAPMVLAALDVGKHVSVQKPMCLSLGEADAMIAAAERAGKLLRVFENFRYYPPLAEAKELLDAGAVGDPMSMRIKVTRGKHMVGEPAHLVTPAWKGDAAQCGEGPFIYDYGSHLWPLVVWLMGDVEKVFGWTGHQASERWGDLDSPAIVTWKHRGADVYGSCDMVASQGIRVSTDYFPEDEWFELTGSRGFIWVTRASGRLLDKPPVVMYRDGVVTEISDVDADWATSFRLGAEDFVDAIVEGRGAYLSADGAKAALQMSCAIQRSAVEGREVRPDEMV